MSTRPDDALFRLRVETFALVRKLLPVALLAGALVGPLYRYEPTTAMWYSAGLFLCVLVGLHCVGRLPLYPPHTFGVEYRLEDAPFADDRRRCVRCGTSVEAGTHRRYARQFVVLGVPLHTLEWGHNDFCDDCAAEGAGSGSTSTAGPAASSGSTSAPSQASAPGSTPTREPRSEPKTDRRETTADASDDGPDRPERARRVERNDETTALELRRAFE